MGETGLQSSDVLAHWDIIVGSVVVLVPLTWAILHFLYRNRLEAQKERIDFLESEIERLHREAAALDVNASSYRQIAPASAETPESSQDGLIAKMVEWTRLTKDIQQRHHAAMESGVPWPGEATPLAERENDLYTDLISRFNRSTVRGNQIADNMKALRDAKPSDWHRLRDELMSLISAK